MCRRVDSVIASRMTKHCLRRVSRIWLTISTNEDGVQLRLYGSTEEDRSRQLREMIIDVTSDLVDLESKISSILRSIGKCTPACNYRQLEHNRIRFSYKVVRIRRETLQRIRQFLSYRLCTSSLVSRYHRKGNFARRSIRRGDLLAKPCRLLPEFPRGGKRFVN